MKRSLSRNAFFSVLCQGVNVLFPMLSAAYVSRVLAPEGMGRVAYGQNLVSYFVMLAALGIPQYGVREIAKSREAPDKLFSELVVINAVSTALVLAGYAVFLFFVPDGLYAVLGLELFFQFFSIDWLYQGKEEYGYIAARNVAVKLLSLTAVLLFVREREDTAVYGLILCLSGGCGHILNVLRGKKHVRLTLSGLNLKRHLAPVLTLMLSVVTASLYCKVDITMLGAMAGSEAVGLYTAAHKVVNLVLTLAAAVTAVFLPRLSQAYQADKQAYGAYLSTGLKAVLLLAVPGAIGLALVAKELTAVLFGPEFSSAARTIQILAVLVVIKGAGDLLCYQAIISSGQERKLIAARIFAGAANIALNAVLIPRWGCDGAAAASVVSEGIVNGLLLRHLPAEARPKVSGAFWKWLCLATAAMVLAVAAVQKFAAGGWMSLALPVAAGGGVYLVAWLLIYQGNAE